MSKFKSFVLIGGLAVMVSLPVRSEVVVGSSSANIQQSIQVVMEKEMDFGTILPGGNADQIIMSLDNSNTIISANNTSTFSGQFSYGHVRVYGIPDSIVNVQTDTSVVLSGAGQDMTLTDFVVSNDGLPLDGSGTKLFYVGATLNINENQLPGLYSGVYNVNVSYQ